MDSKTDQSRMVWLDGMRLLAGLSMLGLHATADANGLPFADSPVEQRVLPMLLRAVLYIARTELFILIAIFLLVLSLERRPRPYAEVIGGQARRLLLPFLFWTVFYAAYTCIKADAFGYLDAHLARLGDPMAWAGFLLLGSSKYHMHFIPTLFALFLFYPLYRKAEQTPALILVLPLALAVRHEIDQFLYAQFWGADWLAAAVRANKIMGYIGYGFAAAALAGLWRRRSLSWSVYGGALLFMGVLFFAVKLVGTYRTVLSGRWPHDFVAGYWADLMLPLVLFAICQATAGRAWPPLLSQLARYSFGIYLCHPIFLDLAEIALASTGLSPFALVLAKIGIALPGAFGLVSLLERTPVLSWTIGLGTPSSLLRRGARISRSRDQASRTFGP